MVTARHVTKWSLPGMLQNGHFQACYKMVTARHVAKWSLPGMMQNGHCQACCKMVTARHVTKWSLPGILQCGHCQACFNMVTSRHVTKWSLPCILQYGHWQACYAVVTQKMVTGQNVYILPNTQSKCLVTFGRQMHKIYYSFLWIKGQMKTTQTQIKTWISVFSEKFGVGFIAIYSLCHLSAFVFLVFKVRLYSVIVVFFDS